MVIINNTEAPAALDPNADLELMDQQALLDERTLLIAESRGSAGNLPDDRLERLCRIYAHLRRRGSGPPKRTTAPTRNRELSDIL